MSGLHAVYQAAQAVIDAHRRLEAARTAFMDLRDDPDTVGDLAESIAAMDTAIDALRMLLPPGLAVPGPQPMCSAILSGAGMRGFWVCNLPPGHPLDHEFWRGGTLLRRWPAVPAPPPGDGTPPPLGLRIRGAGSDAGGEDVPPICA